jgi:putrescine transport system ATP-binding protein
MATGLHVIVAVRPEKIRLIKDIANAPNRIRGKVQDIAYLGDVSIFHVKLDSGQKVQMTLANTRPITDQTLTWGEEAVLEWDANGGVVLAE